MQPAVHLLDVVCQHLPLHALRLQGLHSSHETALKVQAGAPICHWSSGSRNLTSQLPYALHQLEHFPYTGHADCFS